RGGKSPTPRANEPPRRKAAFGVAARSVTRHASVRAPVADSPRRRRSTRDSTRLEAEHHRPWCLTDSPVGLARGQPRRPRAHAAALRRHDLLLLDGDGIVLGWYVFPSQSRL